MFTVNHFFMDGTTLRSRRWTMRKYKTLKAAVRKADTIKGGFVARFGSNNVHTMGEWSL